MIEHLPPHTCYTESFGGAASVLLRKARSISEVYNDLDDTLCGLFEVLRDDRKADRLVRQLRLTPFSRREFLRAYEPATDPVESARRVIVRSFMGFGGDATHRHQTGFRGLRSTCGSTPASEWAGYPEALEQVIARLRGVTFEQKPAAEVMRRYDDARTLHYVDPPYLPSTRSVGNRRCGQGYHTYRHELTEADHIALLDTLADLAGMVVLSGYPSDLYDQRLRGWRRVTRRTRAEGNRPRTEVLWLNPAAAAAMPAPQLFGPAAA